MKEAVTDLVEGYLSPGDEQKGLRETGLCGSWDDARGAAAIIADIKGHRSLR
jgi:hypothetical protein